MPGRPDAWSSCWSSSSSPKLWQLCSTVCCCHMAFDIMRFLPEPTATACAATPGGRPAQPQSVLQHQGAGRLSLSLCCNTRGQAGSARAVASLVASSPPAPAPPQPTLLWCTAGGEPSLKVIQALRAGVASGDDWPATALLKRVRAGNHSPP